MENTEAGYRFLPGTAVFAQGARALPGFAIHHARLLRPVPLSDGFSLIEQHLSAAGRPTEALCGMELRVARQYSTAHTSIGLNLGD
jgi:hypothetical protein